MFKSRRFIAFLTTFISLNVWLGIAGWLSGDWTGVLKIIIPAEVALAALIVGGATVRGLTGQIWGGAKRRQNNKEARENGKEADR